MNKIQKKQRHETVTGRVPMRQPPAEYRVSDDGGTQFRAFIDAAHGHAAQNGAAWL